MVLSTLHMARLSDRWFSVVGVKTLLVAVASLVGLAGVGAVAAAQQDGGSGSAAPTAVVVAQDAGNGDAAPDAAPTAGTQVEALATTPAGTSAEPQAAASAAPADTASDGVDDLADVTAPAPTTGGLSVTYRSDTGGSITTVVLAEGGTVVSSAILQCAVAHRFELPAGTYQVDVVQESGLVTQGDVATSSASAVRSAPVLVTGGGEVDLHCAFSGCEVR
jgi:hypothetical protein